MISSSVAIRPQNPDQATTRRALKESDAVRTGSGRATPVTARPPVKRPAASVTKYAAASPAFRAKIRTTTAESTKANAAVTSRASVRLDPTRASSCSTRFARVTAKRTPIPVSQRPPASASIIPKRARSEGRYRAPASLNPPHFCMQSGSGVGQVDDLPLLFVVQSIVQAGDPPALPGFIAARPSTK